MKFSKNGREMGEAFGTSELGSKTKSLSPCAVLSRNMRLTFNFGSTPFKYPQHGFNQLHHFLDDKEMSVLHDTFVKYCQISNTAAAEQGEDFDDAIFDAGIDALVKDLGISDEFDPGLLIVSWKLGCVRPWVISKAEWMNTWPLYGCAKESDIKKKLTEWRKELTNDSAFTVFYNWVMDYLREDKRILDFEQAKIVWQSKLWLFAFVCFLSHTPSKFCFAKGSGLFSTNGWNFSLLKKPRRSTKTCGTCFGSS